MDEADRGQEVTVPGERIGAPSTGKPPAIEVCRRQAERTIWKGGFVAGAKHVAEAVLGLGVSDSTVEQIHYGMSRLAEWREDPDRAVPPSFGSKTTRSTTSRKE